MNIYEYAKKYDFYKVVKCPVCGHDTLDFYFICEHCGWEYDNVKSDDEYSDPNGCSINEAKEFYKKGIKF